LGVDPDAATDEIRTAYRERKATIDATSESGKADAAQLNKAWNVLSDPYQRGRYDEQRARDGSDDVIDDDDEIEVRGNGRRTPAMSSKRPARPARQGRQLPKPTITLPEGTRWPVPKQRVIAMSIDLLVLLGLFILAAYVVAPAIANATKGDTVDRVDALREQVDDAARAQNDAENALDDAEQTNDPAAIENARRTLDERERAYDQVNDDFTEEGNKLQPIFYAVIGALFLVGMLYLVLPTLATIVGPLAAAIVLVGVIGWMRNGNMQGIHDRFAHTIVVADDNTDN